MIGINKLIESFKMRSIVRVGMLFVSNYVIFCFCASIIKAIANDPDCYYYSLQAATFIYYSFRFKRYLYIFSF